MSRGSSRQLVRPRARLCPYYWRLPVSRPAVRQHLGPLLVLAGVLGGGTGAWAAWSWERIMDLLDRVGLIESLRTEAPLLLYVAVLSTIAFLLLVGVLMRMLNTLLVFSVARDMLLLALLFVVCVLFRQLRPAQGFLGFVMVGLVVVMVLGFLFSGPWGDYLRLRAYGDVVLDTAILVPFLLLSWPPLASTGHVEIAHGILREWSRSLG